MKRANIVAAILCLVFLIEIVLIHRINSKLYFVIDTTVYTGLIGVQIILYFSITRWDRKRRAFLINIILLILIPIVFIFTLPTHTYKDGKTLIENNFPGNNITFIPYEHHLLPLSKRYSWFLKKSAYYYGIEHTGEYFFYAVNPVDGVVFQLEEDFWLGLEGK